MALSKEINAILAGGYEDYCGLHEIVWDLRRLHREATDGELIKIAQPAVIELLDDGLISIYSRFGASSEFLLISDSEARDIVKEPTSWLPPDERGRQYWYVSTLNGDKLYEAEGH